MDRASGFYPLNRGSTPCGDIKKQFDFLKNFCYNIYIRNDKERKED